MRCSQILLTVLLFWTAIVANSYAAPPQWLWADGDRNGIGIAGFGTSFGLDTLPPGEAELRAIGDFCAYQIALNGKPIASAEPYDDAIIVRVKAALITGRNTIKVRARGVDGPSAVAFDLAFVAADGKRTIITISNAKWEGARAIGPLADLGFDGARFRDVDAFAEYNQWKEAKEGEDGAVFAPLPEWFELERLRAAKADEGSWVSMAFDPKGRLVLAREKKGLIRFEMVDGKPVGEPVVIDDSLLECRGLLFENGVLFANANNSKQLFRLRPMDSSGDTFDAPEPLMASQGSVGHGRNDLAAGADGKIYSIHGDSVKLADGLFRRVPKPLVSQPEEGHVIRLDRDGGKRELFCTGLRNPFGIAFNADGEAFTYDADNEGDVGLPFYRPARVNHLVSGADYGWRQGSTWSWPTYAPESLPTTFDLGRGSPTAVEFGTGSHFPRRYRDALFVLDWAYGRIIALDVVPRGASYACRAHTFLQGRPFNVTDLTIGPDGAMYIVTGGRKTQSSLYRIRFTGQKPPPKTAAAQQKARVEFSRQAREARRRLETFHGREDSQAVEFCWPHLDNADPWLRHAALVALQGQPASSWASRALEERNLPALLALVRMDAETPREKMLEAVESHDFEKLSRRDKLCALRIIEISGIPATAYLLPNFPDGEPAVDRELAKQLIRAGEPITVSKCSDLLSGAVTQSDRLYYLDAVSKTTAGWDTQTRDLFFAAIHHPAYFRGDRNMPAFLKTIRERAIGLLTEGERTDLAALIQPATSDPVPLPKPRPKVKHWSVDDLLGAKAAPIDPGRGWQLFEQALCSRCHQLRGRGTALGPDLTQAGARFSKPDLIRAIVHPSEAIAEIFQNVANTKNDGSVVVGRIVRDDFRKSTLSLSGNPFAPGNLTTVSKHDIAKREISPASPMPAGLLDTLTREEAMQLINYILSGGSGTK